MMTDTNYPPEHYTSHDHDLVKTDSWSLGLILNYTSMLQQTSVYHLRSMPKLNLLFLFQVPTKQQPLHEDLAERPPLKLREGFASAGFSPSCVIDFTAESEELIDLTNDSDDVIESSDARD